MKCPTCGNENKLEALFCGICGTSLSSNDGSSGAELPMVSFPEAISRGFKNYVSFSGRATRAEFWWWALFTVIGITVCGFVEGIFGIQNALTTIFRLGTLLPSLAVGARRLHDIDKSGWWQFLWFAIIIGWVILIVWAIRQGNNGNNQHVPDPRSTPRA